jgi:hypothetical protein
VDTALQGRCQAGGVRLVAAASQQAAEIHLFPHRAWRRDVCG